MFRYFTLPTISAFILFATPATAQPAAALPERLTAWSMFMQADWVVKLVMLSLVIASVVTWGICIAKYFEFKRTMRELGDDHAGIADAKSLEDVGSLVSTKSSAIVGVARDEVADCIDITNRQSVDAMTERLSIRLAALEADIIQSMRGGFSILASIGATAPFVGLFGTVWGIMNSFIGISESQTTNLAVVAPGIAEALLATALGLVAAIPAVLVYNIFSRRMAVFRRYLHNIAAQVACLVSREVERAQVTRLKVAV